MKKQYFLILLLLPFLATGQTLFDLSVTAVNLPDVTGNGESATISADIQNVGSASINSFKINYSVKGGQTYTDDVTGLSLSQGDQYTATSSIPYSPVLSAPPPDAQEVKVWISDLNGFFQDEDNSNDTATNDLNVVDEKVQRNVLHEVFTSSTCPPCAPGNTNLANVFAANSNTPIVLKYQMSWPGSGDPYYTAEGGARRSYYGVTGVPTMFLDGGAGINTNSYNGTTMDNYSDIPSYMEVESNYTVTGQTIDINIAFTPLLDIGGNNALHVVVIEKETFNNVGSNGETRFDYVMKKMITPTSGQAIGSLVGGQPQSYNFSYTFNGNYRLPPNASSPINHATEHSVEEFSDLDVVVFVQNPNSREIYHSSHGVSILSSTLDMQVSSVTAPSSAQPGDNVTISAVVDNNQSTAITSFDLNYSINGGTVVTESVSGVTIPQGGALPVNFNTPWTATAGFNKVEVFVTNINGQGSDDLPLNDRSFGYIDVRQSVGLQQGPTFDKNMVTIFPNPVRNNLTISSSLNGDNIVEVFDIIGKKWMAQDLNGEGVYSMDMSSLQDGIYFLRFSNGAESFTKKVVVK